MSPYEVWFWSTHAQPLPNVCVVTQRLTPVVLWFLLNVYVPPKQNAPHPMPYHARWIKRVLPGPWATPALLLTVRYTLPNKQETTRLLPTDVQHLVHRRASFILQNRVCSDGSKLLVDPFVVEPSTYGAPPNLNAVQARKGSVALKNIIDVRVSANLQIVSHAVLSMR